MKITVVVAGLLIVLAVLAAWYGQRWIRMRRGGGVSVALRWRPDNPRSSS
ncbi:DUF2550 domain-containing protein, partial [Amycolatopsis mediterranei]